MEMGIISDMEEIIRQIDVFLEQGSHLLGQGQIREALQLFQQAEQILENINRQIQQVPDVSKGQRDFIASKFATTLNNIGATYLDQGDLFKAIEYFDRALKINESIAPNSPDTANSLNSLGFVYLNQGDLFRAIEYFDQKT
jgi:tetratricopeptide (TPR) repeat protein